MDHPQNPFLSTNGTQRSFNGQHLAKVEERAFMEQLSKAQSEYCFTKLCADALAIDRKDLAAKALSRIKASRNWLRIARQWLEIGDRAKADECLRYAENQAGRANHLTPIARQFHAMKEQEACLRILKKAEDSIYGASELAHVASAAYDCGERTLALEQMRKARQAAWTPAMFFDISRLSWPMVGFDEIAAESQHQGLATAKLPEDFAAAAHSWLAADRLEAAREILLKGEAIQGGDRFSLIELAKAWADLGDMAGWLRCLRRAEKTATSWWDWSAIAVEWAEKKNQNQDASDFLRWKHALNSSLDAKYPLFAERPSP